MKRVLVLASATLACHGHGTSPTPARGSEISARSSISDAVRSVSSDASVDLPIPIDKVPAPSWAPPANTIALTRWDGDTFYMDRTEVIVKEYRECVTSGTCTPPDTGEREPGKSERRNDDERGVSHVCPKERMTWYEPGHDDYPINCVTFSQAWRYCQYRHGRLPTAEEWEFVARGTSEESRRRFPWGDSRPSCRVAVMADLKGPGCGTGGPMPVGSKPKGASPGGALDLIGNVTEIVLTNERPSQGLVDDKHFSAMGGSYADGPTSRITEPLGGGQVGPASPTVGFRCVYYRPGHAGHY